jgi:hypothetical protein
VQYAIVNDDNEPFQSGCGTEELDSDGVDSSGAEIGPFYCFVGESVVYLPADWIAEKGFGADGREFAVAYVVAHEIGHHMQAINGNLERKVMGEVESIQIELQADCLAGVWARTLGRRASWRVTTWTRRSAWPKISAILQECHSNKRTATPRNGCRGSRAVTRVGSEEPAIPQASAEQRRRRRIMESS